MFMGFASKGPQKRFHIPGLKIPRFKTLALAEMVQRKAQNRLKTILIKRGIEALPQIQK